MAQKITSANAMNGTPYYINTFEANDQNFPVVTGLTGGGYAFTYMSDLFGSTPDQNAIAYTQFDATHNMVGIEKEVNTVNTDNQRKATILGLQNNDAIVAWDSFLQDTS